VGGARVGEHGVERVDVSMDVIQRKDVHDRQANATSGLR
jgi:hypothetical protein